jgi:AraC-like DNA-binding protein
MPSPNKQVAYTAPMVLLDEAGLGREDTQVVPAGHLTTFVEHFWIQDGLHPRDRWRIVPDANGYLIFSARNGPSGTETRLVAVGARSHHVDIDVAGRHVTVAARLRPGALAVLTGVPGSELTDRSVPLAELTGRSAGELLDRMSAATPVDAQSQMAAFLSRAFSGADADSLGLGWLLTRPWTVAGLADAIGLGPRSLYERSREGVGLAPKRALRIARLHRALWLADGHRTWSDVAAAAGYADQAHLTRDMQALLGEGPTEWARRGRGADSFKTDCAEKL